MLTRYRGGDKGPIVLVPGFAMQASSFAPPTIDTNLVEFLVERGYDVWLFDYRASIALPTANTSFDIDQVVTEDWPEAIAEVRRVTGAPTVQALGHCVGSLSALMTVLAGTEGIGALVCSQFTVHPVTSRLNRTKNALHIVDAMHALHVRAMRPDARPTWQNKAMDAALAVVPFPRGERCGSPTCRWLNSIFGLTHHHAQLNDATHESFAEAFGWSNIVGLRHLSLISRKQQAVDAMGRDVYLPHVDRVTMPVLFVQGSRNHIFRPAGTQRTVEWLRAHHDPSKIELFEHPDYAHLDMMVGKNASSEVFPRIVEFLDRRQDASTPS
jgi:cholesterol oxidase